MADDEAWSPVPISPQVEGPFLIRKRRLWLRVRFIKMFVMGTKFEQG